MWRKLKTKKSTAEFSLVNTLQSDYLKTACSWTLNPACPSGRAIISGFLDKREICWTRRGSSERFPPGSINLTRHQRLSCTLPPFLSVPPALPLLKLLREHLLYFYNHYQWDSNQKFSFVPLKRISMALIIFSKWMSVITKESLQAVTFEECTTPVLFDDVNQLFLQTLNKKPNINPLKSFISCS